MSCGCQNTSENSPTISIDKSKLLSGDTYSVALFGFASNPNAFEQGLNDLGLDMDGNPLENINYLSGLHDAGGDTEGVLQDGDGEQIRFNFMDLIKSLPIDSSSNNPIIIEFV